MRLTVLYEPPAMHPLAWIHRTEARRVAAELARLGHFVRMVQYRESSVASLKPDAILLRVSDPVMLAVTRTLTRRRLQYFGPAAAVLARCYDKYEASRSAQAHGIDCPATALAEEAHELKCPVVLKPRSGSDSLGVRVLRHGSIPRRLLTARYIVQEQVRGLELTVGVIREHIGSPLRILLPEGTPYSFARKYILTPRRQVLAPSSLSDRVRETAQKVAQLFEINWAARVDFIYDPRDDRLHFLECDAAPLVGAKSALAASLLAAGVSRADQLGLLTDVAPV